MTIDDIIASLEDQARDKARLTGGDPDSIFARDATVLIKAANILRGLTAPPPNGLLAPSTLEGMCCDCVHGAPFCDYDNYDYGINTDCEYRSLDGSCWKPRPAPLKLCELREMAQRCEGVYIAHTDGYPVFRDQKYCAAVLDYSPMFGSTAIKIHAIYGDRLTMWEDEYGKTWLAYRQKPEEYQ